MYTNFKNSLGGWGIEGKCANWQENLTLLEMYEIILKRKWGKDADLSNSGNEWNRRTKGKRGINIEL